MVNLCDLFLCFLICQSKSNVCHETALQDGHSSIPFTTHSEAATFLHITKYRVWRFMQSPQLHLWFLADIHLVMVHWAEVGSFLPQSGHFSQPSVFTIPTLPLFSFFGWQKFQTKDFSHSTSDNAFFSRLFFLLQCCTFRVTFATRIREWYSPFQGWQTGKL